MSILIMNLGLMVNVHNAIFEFRDSKNRYSDSFCSILFHSKFWKLVIRLDSIQEKRENIRLKESTKTHFHITFLPTSSHVSGKMFDPLECGNPTEKRVPKFKGQLKSNASYPVKTGIVEEGRCGCIT